MKIKKNTYAKINLTLNVVGRSDGFHDIESLVTTVNLFDTVFVSKRSDNEIRLTMRGLGEEIKQSENNAYKAAKLFVETFKTGGVNVEIQKRIPLAGGLGGSSADIAGVLNAMKKCFGINADVKPLADKLGSDSGYMLSGGYAIISGRGEKVEKINSDMEINFVLAYAESGVSAADCYSRFDQIQALGVISDNAVAAACLKNGDFSGLCGEIGNALQSPAESINMEIEKNLAEIKALSPSACGMTGSGSTVFGIFESKELCLWAIEKLKRKGIDCEYVKSIEPEKEESKGFFKR